MTFFSPDNTRRGEKSLPWRKISILIPNIQHNKRLDVFSLVSDPSETDFLQFYKWTVYLLLVRFMHYLKLSKKLPLQVGFSYRSIYVCMYVCMYVCIYLVSNCPLKHLVLYHAGLLTLYWEKGEQQNSSR